MKSSRSKALVVATVTSIQDINVTYPYCRECYGKLNQNCHLNEWSCLQCQISYESDCVPYRYRVHLNIADETSSCNVSVFGKTLQPYFGLPAIEMHKFLELQHPKQIMEALKKSFIGKCFVFEFKTTLLKNSSHFCLLSVIKNNKNSLFGSNLIAYQMISNHYTTNDNIHSHLMQYKQLSCSTNLKMSQSNSRPNVNIPISDSAVSSADSALYESIVLSCKIKKSEFQHFNQSLTSFYSDYNSSSFPLNTSKMKESHFPNDNLDFDQNKNVYKEPSQALFTPRKQLHFSFGENMKPNVKNKVEMQEMYQNFENISISEMSQDQIKNIVDPSQDISAKLNPNWKSVSKAIESKDISIFNHFNKRICDCSSQTIGTCTHCSLKKEKIILCSANNSLEDVNIFLKKLSLITNPNHSSTACNLSADLFATISEKMSNFSEKCTVSNPCDSFTPDVQKRKKIITSFYPEKSLLIFNYNRRKIFCQLFDDSNDFHFFCSDQSHLEQRLSFSSITCTPELQKNEKQNNNERTVSSQNKMNRKTTRFKESTKSKSEKRAKKSINKTDFSSLSLNSCTSPNSSFNRLSSKLSYIPKPKTNNCQETLTSTPISDSSVFKNAPFLICAKNCSPQLYDAFGTPMKKTDLQQEDIGCDSPSLLQNESIHCDRFVRFSRRENPVSFDLFVTTDDSHDSLSFSAKNNDNFSHDLFNSESNLFSISSI